MKNLYLLGIDLGSSAVKATLVDAATGRYKSSSFSPLHVDGMKILSPQKGWAEQDPLMWEENVRLAIERTVQSAEIHGSQIVAIGITYQMHGLVCLDKDGKVLRPAIIWCDSRAVETGNKALEELGRDFCLLHYLNYPGNFTASRMKWVKDHEPGIFALTDMFMLPGDWLAYRLTGEKRTTRSGLSECMLWDFSKQGLATELLDLYGIPASMIPPLCDTFGMQGELSREAASFFSLSPGIRVTYRAGDQPNNAFSLNVLEPGEIAATAGTSGVVYSVSDQDTCDPLSRLNTFLHVNDSAIQKRNGILLCLNGCGIGNSWIRRICGGDAWDTMDAMASTVPPGSRGLMFFPFGNGAERMLGNLNLQASFEGIDFKVHLAHHMYRAVQEGVAFAFRYGIDLMRDMGIRPSVIKAGMANLFLSPVFAQTLADLADVEIRIFNTDGALGAALGARIGMGVFQSPEKAFSHLHSHKIFTPGKGRKKLAGAYETWKNCLLDKVHGKEPGKFLLNNSIFN